MDKELRLKIGVKVRKMRINAGYNNMDVFADYANLAKTTYQKIETGCHNFRFGTLVIILEFHNMTLSEFFSDLHTIKPEHAT